MIDWPSRDVPESLARAGLRVIVRGGPGPEDFSAWEAKGGEVVSRKIGRAPERVDLVYAYRPVSELPQIIATAKSLHAAAIWTQGMEDTAARPMVEAAGIEYFSGPDIAQTARSLSNG